MQAPPFLAISVTKNCPRKGAVKGQKKAANLRNIYLYNTEETMYNKISHTGILPESIFPFSCARFFPPYRAQTKKPHLFRCGFFLRLQISDTLSCGTALPFPVTRSAVTPFHNSFSASRHIQ
jgi:hypothetical protein